MIEDMGLASSGKVLPPHSSPNQTEPSTHVSGGQPLAPVSCGISEELPPGPVLTLAPPALDLFVCTPSNNDTTPSLLPLEISMLASKMPNPSSFEGVDHLLESLPYYNEDRLSKGFCDLFGDFICVFTNENMVLHSLCTELTEKLKSSSNASFTRRYRFDSTWSTLHNGIPFEGQPRFGFLEVLARACLKRAKGLIALLTPARFLISGILAIGSLWLVYFFHKMSRRLISVIIALSTRSIRWITSRSTSAFHRVMPSLYQMTLDVTFLCFRIVLAIRPIARLVNVVYGFSQLGAQMHSLENFIPFSGKMVEAVEAFGLSVIRLLVIQVSCLLLDLYIDDLESKLCKQDKSTRTQAWQPQAPIDGLPSSSPLWPRIVIDSYEDRILSEFDLTSSLDTRPCKRVDAQTEDPFATPKVSQINPTITLLSVTPKRVSFNKKIMSKQLEPKSTMDESDPLDQFVVPGSLEDNNLTITATCTAASFMTALESPPSPATSEESALITPTNTSFFGTLEPLPSEEVKATMREARVLYGKMPRVCSCLICRSHRSSPNASTYDSTPATPRLAESTQPKKVRGLNMLFDDQSFRLPRTATITENPFFRQRDVFTSTPDTSASKAGLRGTGLIARLQKMTLERQMRKENKPKLLPSREIDSPFPVMHDSMFDTSTPESVYYQKRNCILAGQPGKSWDTPSAELLTPSRNLEQDLLFSVLDSPPSERRGIEIYERPYQHQATRYSTIARSSQSLTSSTSQLGRDAFRGPQFMVQIKAMTAARIKKQQWPESLSSEESDSDQLPSPIVETERNVHKEDRDPGLMFQSVPLHSKSYGFADRSNSLSIYSPQVRRNNRVARYQKPTKASANKKFSSKRHRKSLFPCTPKRMVNDMINRQSFARQIRTPTKANPAKLNVVAEQARSGKKASLYNERRCPSGEPKLVSGFSHNIVPFRAFLRYQWHKDILHTASSLPSQGILGVAPGPLLSVQQQANLILMNQLAIMQRLVYQQTVAKSLASDVSDDDSRDSRFEEISY